MKDNCKHNQSGHSHSHNHGRENGHNNCHGHCHGHEHNHEHNHGHGAVHGFLPTLRLFLPEIVSLVLLIVSVCIDWGNNIAQLLAFIVAVMPVGVPILIHTLKEWSRGDIFNEFTLMVMACVGAFILEEYPEGVAILLFYSVGEKLEDVVSGDVTSQIKKLLGRMPKKANVLVDGHFVEMNPDDVKPGMVISVKAGEAIPLDGKLINDNDVEFNTSAITGESMPRSYSKGDILNSGIIPIGQTASVEVTSEYADSSMTRIMNMIEDASAHRSPSETILRRITRWYTPLVALGALLLFMIPWIVSFFSASYEFEWYIWFKRSLVFLICSCPCALIVSIPLSYFASIGIASKKGILFKGHDALDSMRNIDTVYFDKTGTVTTGVFHVDNIKTYGQYGENEVLAITAAIESESTHPLAIAIVSEASRRGCSLPEAEDIRIISHGITAVVGNRNVLAGSKKLMESKGISLDDYTTGSTSVFVAIDGAAAACIELQDTLKDGIKEDVAKLHKLGVHEVGILSGDIEESVKKVADEIGADSYRAVLLPGDKQRIIQDCESRGSHVAFAGDGVNDGPALAAANVGIAMGDIGTDIAIESAQVVIASGNIEKISDGIDISKRVKRVIVENVTFAFGVKIAVMILGAFGIATLWAAVFADTGVTVVTILWTLYRLKIWQLKESYKK